MAIIHDALVLDMSAMKHIDIDPQTATAWVEAGVTLKDLDDVTCPQGLAAVNRELKIETFSGRRQLQPDVTSSFVGYCACSCSPPCRRDHDGKVVSTSMRNIEQMMMSRPVEVAVAPKTSLSEVPYSLPPGLVGM